MGSHLLVFGVEVFFFFFVVVLFFFYFYYWVGLKESAVTPDYIYLFIIYLCQFPYSVLINGRSVPSKF